jgi:hypothetical protein
MAKSNFGSFWRLRILIKGPYLQINPADALPDIGPGEKKSDENSLNPVLPPQRLRSIRESF